MVLKRKSYDKQVIIYVGRKDKIVPYFTKARRMKDPAQGVCYEILSPNNNKIKYRVGDIPTDYFSSSGVIELYTEDFEQFIPSKLEKEPIKERTAKHAKVKIHNIQNLELHLLTSDQKVWYAKSVREDIEKTMKQTWWNDNKTIILTIIVLVALCVLAYILMNGIMGSAQYLNSAVSQIMAPPVPVNITGMPPV